MIPSGKRADVVVVGAGIVGAACARALAHAGVNVLVLESSFPGCGTTAAAMGHVVVMDDSAAQFALTAYSQRLWSELADELPKDVQDERLGTIWVAADDEDLEAARIRAAFYAERGVEAALLSDVEVYQNEPHLRPGLAGGLLVSADRVLYPPAAVRWLVDDACRIGAEIRRGVGITAIGPASVKTRDGWIEADAVVNAAGLGAAALTPGMPIEPRKGHLVVTDRYPGFCRRQLVELGYLKSAHGHDCQSTAFNVQPRATGQLLIGSSREFVGLDATINRPLRDRMLARAVDYLPALATCSILRTWVGFRPCTPDNLPLVGRWEPVRGLYVAAGHEGLGVTTSLGTANLIADAVLGRPSQIDPHPYAPGRFAGSVAHG